MVIEKGISVQSYCEHHFVNIDGLATVAYVPNSKVLGLSKMNRIVEYFSMEKYSTIRFIFDNPSTLLFGTYATVASPSMLTK